MEPTILTRNNKKRGIITQSLYFRTLSMPCLNYYYELFIKITKKSTKQLGRIINRKRLSLLNNG